MTKECNLSDLDGYCYTHQTVMCEFWKYFCPEDGSYPPDVEVAA